MNATPMTMASTSQKIAMAPEVDPTIRNLDDILDTRNMS